MLKILRFCALAVALVSSDKKFLERVVPAFQKDTSSTSTTPKPDRKPQVLPLPGKPGELVNAISENLSKVSKCTIFTIKDITQDNNNCLCACSSSGTKCYSFDEAKKQLTKSRTLSNAVLNFCRTKNSCTSLNRPSLSSLKQCQDLCGTCDQEELRKELIEKKLIAQKPAPVPSKGESTGSTGSSTSIGSNRGKCSCDCDPKINKCRKIDWELKKIGSNFELEKRGFLGEALPDTLCESICDDEIRDVVGSGSKTCTEDMLDDENQCFFPCVRKNKGDAMGELQRPMKMSTVLKDRARFPILVKKCAKLNPALAKCDPRFIFPRPDALGCGCPICLESCAVLFGIDEEAKDCNSLIRKAVTIGDKPEETAKRTNCPRSLQDAKATAEKRLMATKEQLAKVQGELPAAPANGVSQRLDTSQLLSNLLPTLTTTPVVVQEVVPAEEVDTVFRMGTKSKPVYRFTKGKCKKIVCREFRKLIRARNVTDIAEARDNIKVLLQARIKEGNSVDSNGNSWFPNIVVEESSTDAPEEQCIAFIAKKVKSKAESLINKKKVDKAKQQVITRATAKDKTAIQAVCSNPNLCGDDDEPICVRDLLEDTKETLPCKAAFRCANYEAQVEKNDFKKNFFALTGISKCPNDDKVSDRDRAAPQDSKVQGILKKFKVPECEVDAFSFQDGKSSRQTGQLVCKCLKSKQFGRPNFNFCRQPKEMFLYLKQQCTRLEVTGCTPSKLVRVTPPESVSTKEDPKDFDICQYFDCREEETTDECSSGDFTLGKVKALAKSEDGSKCMVEECELEEDSGDNTKKPKKKLVKASESVSLRTKCKLDCSPKDYQFKACGACPTCPLTAEEEADEATANAAACARQSLLAKKLCSEDALQDENLSEEEVKEFKEKGARCRVRSGLAMCAKRVLAFTKTEAYDILKSTALELAQECSNVSLPQLRATIQKFDIDLKEPTREDAKKVCNAVASLRFTVDLSSLDKEGIADLTECFQDKIDEAGATVDGLGKLIRGIFRKKLPPGLKKVKAAASTSGSSTSGTTTEADVDAEYEVDEENEEEYIVELPTSDEAAKASVEVTTAAGFSVVPQSTSSSSTSTSTTATTDNGPADGTNASSRASFVVAAVVAFMLSALIL